MIDAWKAAGLRDQALEGCGLRASGVALEGRKPLRGGLDCCLSKSKDLQEFAERCPHGLLAKAFNRHWAPVAQTVSDAAAALPNKKDPRWTEPGTSDLDGDLDTIRSGIAHFRDALPHLLVGAVDVGSGEFVAFSSQRAPGKRGISSDCLRATAAIPWLFKGVEIKLEHDPDDAIGDDTPLYWDGLFSQNPPISVFLSGADRETKPDEIWLAQVNPQRCRTGDIEHRLWDRRNELSGNLSINQEIAAIGAINARIVRAAPGDGTADDKRVRVFRIPMDSDRLEVDLGRKLDPSSKMDRSAALKEALFRHGDDQAKRFFSIREIFELTWNVPGSTRRTVAVRIEGLPETGIAGLRDYFGNDLSFEVADMVIESYDKEQSIGGVQFESEAHRARISWQCHLKLPAKNGAYPQRARLEGMAVIGLDGDNEIVGARMTSICLTRPDIPAKRVGLRTVPLAA